jgi:hypothetical protein
MFYAADRQAWVLRNLFPLQAIRIAAHLSNLIPSDRVDYIDNLPVPGTAFWGNNRWHIHLRASDPADTQAFTVLHELKHIIDHPLRQQPNSLDAARWEALANYFATQVLAQETRSGRGSVIKNDGTNNDIPTDLHDSPSQPNAKTGGTR